MKKHLWISGLKINQIVERHPYLGNLEWNGKIPSTYSFHVFTNESDTAGIVACSDAFGGGVAWANYKGKNELIGKEIELSVEEIKFLREDYPKLLEAINNL